MVMATKKRVFRISDELYDAVQEKAKKKKKSLTEIVINAFIKFLK
jgi:predicted HicB family RNase H-like nuclease